MNQLIYIIINLQIATQNHCNLTQTNRNEQVFFLMRNELQFEVTNSCRFYMNYFFFFGLEVSSWELFEQAALCSGRGFCQFKGWRRNIGQGGTVNYNLKIDSFEQNVIENYSI